MTDKNVKKIDIANAVSAASGLNVDDSIDIVDLYFDVISKGVVEDGEVKIMNFGTFIKKGKASRMGRNPKTGEPAIIKARNTVLFHPSKKKKAI
ncbi:MAG: HU family DNA-binding protein [Alphaproteobacteria bacterium]|nr:HU family DNA-binding protein [Alphaproteobacteria bacterium]